LQPSFLSTRQDYFTLFATEVLNSYAMKHVLANCVWALQGQLMMGSVQENHDNE
jgi:hypothetical protein